MKRLIVLKNFIGKNQDIIVQTNAPSEEIKKANDYKNYILENGLEKGLCDFEIIQNYLEEKGYCFFELNTDEKYYI